MLLVYSKNLLKVDIIINYTDLLLVAYLSDINNIVASSWPVTQVQNYPWWIVVEWDE